MAVPWRSPKLPVILSSTLIGIMGVALLGPVLPTLKGQFTVTDAQVGLVLTAYTAPGILLAPFVGLIADRVGRRRVLVPLLVVYGLAGTGIVAANSFDQLLVLRFRQGIGASSLITLAVTLIGDYFDGRQRSEVVSLNSSVIGIGAAVFPAIGGALVLLSWQAPFAFFAVSLLVAVLALVVLDEPGVDRTASFSGYAARLRGVLRNRTVLGMYAAALATYVLFYGGVLTAMPLLLDETYGLSALEIGVLLALTSVASATIASQNVTISERADVSTVLGIAFVVFGTAFLGIWYTDSVLFMGTMLLLFGVGVGLTMPSIDRTLVTVVPADQRAGVLGLESSMIWSGQTIGPVLFPVLASEFFVSAGYSRLFFIAGTLSLLGGIVALQW